MNLLYTIDQKSLFYRQAEKKIGLEFAILGNSTNNFIRVDNTIIDILSINFELITKLEMYTLSSMENQYQHNVQRVNVFLYFCLKS